MFLYASDWTTAKNLQWLEANGFPNSGKLVKIFASAKDPREILRREIKTTEEDGGEFKGEFKFKGRGAWLDSELEYMLKGHFKLDEEHAAETRALFRFAYNPDVEIAQLAMSIKNAETGTWHYGLPLGIIDGLEEAITRGKPNGLHLDIFTSRSLERVTGIFQLDDPQNFAKMREVVQINKEKETPAISKERS